VDVAFSVLAFSPAAALVTSFVGVAALGAFETAVAAGEAFTAAAVEVAETCFVPAGVATEVFEGLVEAACAVLKASALLGAVEVAFSVLAFSPAAALVTCFVGAAALGVAALGVAALGAVTCFVPAGVAANIVVGLTAFICFAGVVFSSGALVETVGLLSDFVVVEALVGVEALGAFETAVAAGEAFTAAAVEVDDTCFVPAGVATEVVEGLLSDLVDAAGLLSDLVDAALLF
jgi:hypothetical protein